MKTFEQFRRELADAVTVAINSGRRIGAEARISDRETCCPLGVGTFDFDRFPLRNEAALRWEISPDQAHAFSDGFDGVSEDTGKDSNGPFFRLGRLYRQRFVEGR